ncbi:MAG: 2', 3'-cyclic nucleotide 2'-phosphodiesterase, partial [Endozoicomonas sp.]
IPDRKNSITLFEELEKGWVSVRMAKGLCHLGTLPDKPLVFVAAGTGFAQMKSMIEHCFHQNHPHAMHLYWGARSPEGFYLPCLPVHWSSSQFHYHPVVSEVSDEGIWEGRQGLLFEAILADKEQLKDCEIYISGSPQMVYATIDALVRENFKDKNIHSDVFEYAPRH